ncbi:MAG: glycosyltransferase family 2 protein, partial [Bryobacteraceae bacterium]
MNEPVKVLFASGSLAVVAQTVERMTEIFPGLKLLVVSEFPPPAGEWVRYHIKRSLGENCALVHASLKGRGIQIGAMILEPRIPHWKLRLLGLRLAPAHLLIFNETGAHFALRPRGIPMMVHHGMWRARNSVRTQFSAGGWMRKQWRRATNPSELRLPLVYRLALLRGRFPLHQALERATPLPAARPAGISVVIPSRNGGELLDRCLPRSYDASEIVVVDNGSNNGTANLLRREFPSVILEHSAEPLSFARAVNLGLRRARFSHVCVLNNDMLVEPGFFTALRDAFNRVPGLFAATAQIFFPEGARREETGITVMPASRSIADFPVCCIEPLEGEDLSYVLYGSGGCTLYDAAKLASLSGFDEAYDPAYVEDLDLGVRAWQRGWPSVYRADARVLHLHRATTSRYFTTDDLDRFLELNYIRFLSRAVA